MKKALSLYFYLLSRPKTALEELEEVMGLTHQELHKRIKALREAGIGINIDTEEVYLEDDSVFSFLLSEGEEALLKEFQELIKVKDEASLQRVTDIFRLRVSMDRADLGYAHKRYLATEDNREDLLELLEEAIKKRNTLMLTLHDSEGIRECVIIPHLLLELGGISYLSATSSSEQSIEVLKLDQMKVVEVLGVQDERGENHFDLIIPKDAEDDFFHLKAVKHLRSSAIGEEYLHVQGSIVDLNDLADWLDDLGDFEVLGPRELQDLFD